MSEINETYLTETLNIPESHPQGYSFTTDGKLINQFVVNVPNFVFQRFYIYDSGTVIEDEVSQGKRFIRTNKKFQVNGDQITFS